MNLRDRIAEALFRFDWADRDWHESTDNVKQTYYVQAAAVIAALELEAEDGESVGDDN